MKTPKRHLEIAPFEFDDRIAPEYISMQRWKRKNRIRQLKATIARQAEEIEHLASPSPSRVMNGTKSQPSFSRTHTTKSTTQNAHATPTR